MEEHDVGNVMWEYDFESLNSLSKNSFAAITVKIDLALESENDFYNNSNGLDTLVSSCKRLIQHNGTIRIVSYWSTLSGNSVTNSVKYHSKLIQVLQKYDFLVIDQLGTARPQAQHTHTLVLCSV